MSGQFRRFFGASLTAVAVAFSALAVEAADFNMKVGIIARNDPLEHYITRFKEIVEDQSDGRIDVTLYPGAQLGGESTLVEGVQIGTIEMIAVPGVYMKGLAPRFQIADAPGLFRDIDHANETLQDPEFRDVYLNLAEDVGVKGISVWVYDTTSFATVEPVNELSDLGGRKMRVLASDTEMTIMEDLGAVPVSMPFTDVVPSLQQNTIDGVRTSPIMMSAFKTQTAAKYLTATDDGTIAIAGLVNSAFFDRLPEDLKQVVLEAGVEAEVEMRDFVKKRQAAAQSAWIEAGGEVGALSDRDREKLLEINRNASEQTLAIGNLKEFFELLKTVSQSH
ncbi:TRAP transporter substrate-binding protein [Stappia stellulata]|uniref:TRAP transporter substrate-binding protein n=1 Tax=Stappia stellulata TaxID=71235 RepID=UPI0004173B65|nr:TRAP transporter substrate-binding protein [Stappia stellulata]